jgi:hypothetical protein
MTASITFFQTFREYMADGTIDLNSDAFKVTLHSSAFTPNAATMSVYADLTNELATANGYTSGGLALGTPTWVRSTVTVTFDGVDSVWNAVGGSIAARYAVIRKSGTANARVDPLIAYILLDTTPADVTAGAGNPLTIAWNASGIFAQT